LLQIFSGLYRPDALVGTPTSLLYYWWCVGAELRWRSKKVRGYVPLRKTVVPKNSKSPILSIFRGSRTVRSIITHVALYGKMILNLRISKIYSLAWTMLVLLFLKNLFKLTNHCFFPVFHRIPA